jgi:hypothetical protein
MAQVRCDVTGELVDSYMRIKLDGQQDVIVSSPVYVLLVLGHSPTDIRAMLKNMRRRLSTDLKTKSRLYLSVDEAKQT